MLAAEGRVAGKPSLVGVSAAGGLTAILRLRSMWGESSPGSAVDLGPKAISVRRREGHAVSAIAPVSYGRARFTVRSGVSKTVLRGSLSAGIALGLAHLKIAGRTSTVCPLRALTGIPCPVCGGTTAAVRLGHLDVIGALRANPFVLLGGLGVVLAPAILGVTGSRTDAWSARARGKLTTIAVVGTALFVALSELWQLVRFGIV
jgi:Protein of unknown function (DUF2752)